MAESEYNATDMLNAENSKVGAQMLDKLSRCSKERRVQPLNQRNYIKYPHRQNYGTYNLQIGDSTFVIPPEFIMVTCESSTSQIVTLRQENTQKEKHGHHKKIILIDLVFSDIDQINGYKVPAPKHKDSNKEYSEVYYVDGLRQLLAQIKCTPFLPITNEMLNITYGIFVVAMQSITISTVKGFPDVLKAQVTLQSVEMMPYIDAPNVCFHEMIDWDLFRYYYQSFLTENHKYKRLQSINPDHRYDHFKLSILDGNIFDDDNASTASILDICTDNKIYGEGNTNYITYIDSEKDDVIVEEFECGYSNILTNIQLSQMSEPTLQFLGGMDTVYNVTFRTQDINIVQALQQCQIANDMLIRSNPEIQSCLGFAKLECELVEFTGSLFVMIDSVVTGTVPGFPGLYSVQLNCVSYDIAQSEREQINGFRPFDDTLNTGTTFESVSKSGKIYEEELIVNGIAGVLTKAKQDMYAERKLMQMELYPDLRLPTYEEIDEVIDYVNQFRSANNLDLLPYTKYPVDPVCGLHGQLPSKIFTNNNWAWPHEVSGIKSYRGYVDPDFYVFYYLTNELIYNNSDTKPKTPTARNGYDEEALTSEVYKSKTMGNYDGTIVESPLSSYRYGIGEGNYYSGNYSGSTLADQFVLKARSYIGAEYEYGVNDGKQFDCSGLANWCLDKIGISHKYFTAQNDGSGIEERIKEQGVKDYVIIKEWPDGGGATMSSAYSEIVAIAKPGDIITCKWGYSVNKHKRGARHIMIYSGNGNVIQAKGEDYGVVEDSLKTNPQTSTYQIVGIYRMQKFIDEFEALAAAENITENTSNDDNSTITDNSKYTLTVNDMHTIAACVSGLAESHSKVTLIPFAQYIYDRVTGSNPMTINDIVGELGVWEKYVINYHDFDNDPIKSKYHEVKLSRESYEAVEKVFIENEKWCENRIKHYVMKHSGYGDPNYDKDVKELENLYINLGYADTVLFFGTTEKSSNIKYTLETYKDETTGETGERLVDPTETDGQYLTPDETTGYVSIDSWIDLNTLKMSHKSKVYRETDITSVFGEPILIRTDYAHQHMSQFNKTDIQLYTSFCDQYHYSKRCRLVRAFPTYLIAFLDDDGAWYDGKKLWANYYTHKSVIEIHTHAAYDMPVETATITITNSIHSLDRTDYNLRGKYNIYKDEELWSGGLGVLKPIRDFRKWLYENFNISFGIVGGKLTSTMIQLQQVISTNAKLQEGARIHIRLGYGSDPGSLATVMNGVVTECSLGDQITIVASSDGAEMINQVISADKSDTNTGLFGFGLGATQEPSNIICEMLNTYDGISILRKLSSTNYEEHAYGMEHYGTLISSSIITQGGATIGEGSDYTDTSGAGAAVGTAIGSGIGIASGIIVGSATVPVVGWIVGGVLTVGLGIAGAIGGADADDNDEGSGSISQGANIFDAFTGQYNNFDRIMNIYKSSYKGELYSESALAWLDGEENIIYDQFNMTPWDVCQVCANNAPEYIVKSSYYHFDSRVYYGLPFFLERTRYFFANIGSSKTVAYDKNLWQEAKTASQVHYLNSMDGIIDNQITVSGKHTYTNVKVMYLRGEEGATTQPLYSDMTIDSSRQKTKILDTPIYQDALFWDKLYEFFGAYKVGKDAAVRTGISELIYGWQQQYQGQIICTGQPGMKPNDHILLADMYSELHGICMIREINHSFSVSTGFTTSITPGMVAIDGQNHRSGMTEYVTNYLSILQMFTEYTLARAEMYETYEMNLAQFASMYVSDHIFDNARSKLDSAETLTTVGDICVIVGNVSGIIGTVRGFSAMFATVRKMGGVVATVKTVGSTLWKNLKIIWKGLEGTVKFSKEAGVVSSTFTSVGNVATAIKNLKFVGLSSEVVGTGKTVLTTVKSAVSGVLSKVWFWLILVDLAVSQIVQYIKNKNCIWLVPLWKDNQPFATNIKNGEKILLFGNDKSNTEDYED